MWLALCHISVQKVCGLGHFSSIGINSSHKIVSISLTVAHLLYYTRVVMEDTSIQP